MLDLAEIYTKIEAEQKWYTPQKLRDMRRLQYKMTQAAFSELLGVCKKTYEDWEYGKHVPNSAARSLLLIAKNYPDIFLKNREKIIRTFLT